MFQPDTTQLKRYADILTHFALNSGKGIASGQTVLLCAHESAKPLYWAVYQAIIQAGGNVIPRYLPDETARNGENRILLEHGSDEQLAFAPTQYWEGMIADTDHMIFLLSEADVHRFSGIPSERIMKRKQAQLPFRKMKDQKEQAGELSWTLCLYPTESMAEEAGMAIEEYWAQIVQACYLDHPDPVSRWKQIDEEIGKVRETLTDMEIERLHLESEDADLWLTIGQDRKWLSGSGHNIPSFEVFVSPDWRGTEGWIRFNQPLYYTGTRISGIYLEFEEGVVTNARAEENEEVLHAMIAQEGADKVGEYSLTDRRHSRITTAMATTLYDENMGGEQGNTHLALGNSFRESYKGDVANISDERFSELGFNYCGSVHTDIISTAKRKVSAYCKDGTESVIYQDGEFTFL